MVHYARAFTLPKGRLVLTGLVGKILLMSSTGVVLLGLCLGVFITSLLLQNAEATARARVESNMRVAWQILRERSAEITVADGRMLIGNYVVNGTSDIVDRVRILVGGTCTIFMGDVRISTNVRAADGRRAVGTTLAHSPAYDAVFKHKKSFRGETDILDEPYMTAYDPIFDQTGNVIGVLYVGIKKAEFLSAVWTSLWATALATLTLSALALAASFLIAQSSIVAPLQVAVTAMRQLAEGRLDVEIAAPSKSEDEIGQILRSLAVFRANALERAELQSAERAARQRLTAAVESISEGFTLWDENDRLTLCNQVWLDMWGVGPEVMGLPFSDMLYMVILRQSPGQMDTIEQRMADHISGTGTHEYKLEDGRIIQVRERKTTDGCTVGLYADVTEFMRS